MRLRIDQETIERMRRDLYAAQEFIAQFTSGNSVMVDVKSLFSSKGEIITRGATLLRDQIRATFLETGMRDEIEQMITDCERRESKLTDWERGFVDDMRARLERGQGLTKGQEEKLEQIWDRVTI